MSEFAGWAMWGMVGLLSQASLPYGRLRRLLPTLPKTSYLGICMGLSMLAPAGLSSRDTGLRKTIATC